MRVATYNVHDCVGRGGRFDPSLIAEVLNGLDADLIALQEVTLDAAGDLVARFESMTALRAIDGGLFSRGVGRYGNLVLCRDTLVSSRLHDLSLVGRELRGCIELDIEHDGVRLAVFATHLGLGKAERRTQVARIAELAAASHEACIVLGDFNLWPREATLRSLTALGFSQQPVRSFPIRPWPLLALDRILVRGSVSIRRCWRHDNAQVRRASDHFPVLADVQVDVQVDA